MKKLYALFTLLLACGVINAQYYLLPAFDAGNNPGGTLNDDPEQTEAFLAQNNYGWTTIMGSTSTDTWSSSQTIPFNFNFNGTAVTSYAVSNTGVLTFSSSPGLVPPSNPSALPSPLIPNMSVCAWGINLSGGNDAVVRKTFGTAPNRQHWIMYASASTATTNWTYWSIVLEESTNSIYVVDQRTYSQSGGNCAITVGIQVSAGNAIQVSASPSVSSNTTATGGNGDDPSDNTWYEFAYGTQASYDLAATDYDVLPLVQTGSGVDIDIQLRNRGSMNVSSMDLNYRVNGGSTVTAGISSLNIASGDFFDVTHPTQWTPSVDGSYTVEVWGSNINGNADGVNGNDTITFSVAAVANPPQRVVVIEEKTGTWCGWCPRGLVGMDDITKQYPNTVAGIAVHNNDPMEVSTYDANINVVAPGGYPGSAVDRVLGPDPNTADLQDAYDERQDVSPSASVAINTITYNSGTGQISVDASAEFFATYSNSDLRFVMVLTEDGVTGTSSGYAQVNYYSSTSQNLPLNGYGRNWQTSPNPVPASQMVYDHVARGIYPGFFGAANSVPANVSFGQTVNYTMNATLPSAVQDDNKVHVIVMVVDNSTYEILNAKSVSLIGGVSVEEELAADVQVYPNPAKDRFFVNAEAMGGGSIQISLVNNVGQVVYTAEHDNAAAAEINTANLSNGVYILNVTSEDKTVTERISIVK